MSDFFLFLMLEFIIYDKSKDEFALSTYFDISLIQWILLVSFVDSK